jgi:hypothetical protein
VVAALLTESRDATPAAREVVVWSRLQPLASIAMSAIAEAAWRLDDLFLCVLMGLSASCGYR